MADLYEIFLFEPVLQSTNWALDLPGSSELGLSTYLAPVPASALPVTMILQNWEYLEFFQRVSAPWNHTIRLRGSIADEQVQFIRDQVQQDWIVEVYRTDPITKDKEKVYEGFNRTIVFQTTGSGSVVVSLYGSGYTELLYRRIVIPTANEDAVEKSGNAETVMKQYVVEQAAAPTDADRSIIGLTIDPDGGGGGPVSYSARYTNLATVIARLAEDGHQDFGIVGGSRRGTFIFRTAKQWGMDRRIINQAGNTPVLFDFTLDNMTIPIASFNTSDEKTVAYVGGSGEARARLISQVEDIPGIDKSPWNRRESFVEARTVDSLANLETLGRAFLRDNRARENLSFNINQGPGSRWLTDWGLGDLITSRFLDIIAHKKVVEVHVTVTAEGGGGGVSSQREFVVPELEDILPEWLLGLVGFSELEETTLLGV